MRKKTVITSSFYLIVAAILASCATPAERLGERPTVQQLDEWGIQSMTETRARTGVQGYDGISGRIMELLLVVADDMAKRHQTAERAQDHCGENPIPNHAFFYKEESEVLRVQTAPRWVPDQAPLPPPPDGYRNIYMSDIADVPKNSVLAAGCEIQYVIDKSTKQIIETKPLR